MDPWMLAKDGHFAAAIAAYSSCLKESPTVPNYRNRALCYLNLGELDAALADFEAAEAIRKSSGDVNLKSIGVVHWLAGRPEEATAIWEQAVQGLDSGKLTYTDAAGGVESPSLLWFAAVRLGDKEKRQAAERSLQRVRRTGRRDCFPAAIGPFLLGDQTAEGVRASISDVPIRRERDLCKVEFYVAAKALAEGRPTEYQQGLRRCVKHSVAILENELYLARYELLRQV